MGNKSTVYLTKEGLEELKNELDNLINVKRPELEEISRTKKANNGIIK